MGKTISSLHRISRQKVLRTSIKTCLDSAFELHTVDTVRAECVSHLPSVRWIAVPDSSRGHRAITTSAFRSSNRYTRQRLLKHRFLRAHMFGGGNKLPLDMSSQEDETDDCVMLFPNCLIDKQRKKKFDPLSDRDLISNHARYTQS